MNRFLLFLLLSPVVIVGFILILRTSNNSLMSEITNNIPLQKANPQSTSSNNFDIEIVAENLDTPWAIAFLPTGEILVTERAGAVRLVGKDRKLQQKPVAQLASVKEIGEGGLLGIAVHPRFSANKYVYLYYTYSASGENTLNRVVRMTYSNDSLSGEEIILDNIPGASNHNGGRIKFGPDGYLYIGTGDAQEPSRAQDKNSLAGKILRITDNGQPAPGNPFNNPVYSWGHRNVQGLAWDGSGQLYATEHGRSGVTSGLDEINIINPGLNYGWPTIQGDNSQNGLESPVIHSGSTTWAPAGMAFVNNTFYFGGLRGRSLYKAPVEANDIKQVDSLLESKYGRIREVVLGPDNMLYITTSNRDGRGTPDSTDDRVLRINPSNL